MIGVDLLGLNLALIDTFRMTLSGSHGMQLDKVTAEIGKLVSAQYS